MALMYYSCKGRFTQLFTSDDIHNQTTPPKTKTIKTDKQNEVLNTLKKITKEINLLNN